MATDKGPSLVDEIYHPRHHGHRVFHFAVSKGASQHHWHFGNMLPVPGLTPKDVGNIVAFVRYEQRKAGIK